MESKASSTANPFSCERRRASDFHQHFSPLGAPTPGMSAGITKSTSPYFNSAPIGTALVRGISFKALRAVVGFGAQCRSGTKRLWSRSCRLGPENYHAAI